MPKTTFNDRFEIDDIDKKIITALQDDPDLLEEELAEDLRLSKEIVGARITKLLRKHLLHKSYGVSFKKAGLLVARVDFYATNPEEIIDQFAKCPFGLNLYKTTGEYNFSLLLSGVDLAQIERVIDHCLRTNPNVQTIQTNYLMDAVHDFDIPLRFDLEGVAQFGCIRGCQEGAPETEVLEIIEEVEQPT